MTYPFVWEGKTDPDDKSGIARFVIEGHEFAVPMPTFTDAKRLDDMLWLAFRQGKSFAFNAIKGHIAQAMKSADQAHHLSLPAAIPVNEGKAGDDGGKAHSKSEYKRRVALGDPNVTPPHGVALPPAPPGYKLVPIEPTQEMVDAGDAEAPEPWRSGFAREMWKAMLDAAGVEVPDA